jgi:ABC-type nitrate/sulfonate/bicarbonate transport system substrate-binding protein
LAATFAILAVPGTAQQQQLSEVVFGELNPTAAEWPIYLAQDQGYFTAEGIKVTVINGATPPNVITQAATGSVDIADDGTDSEIAAIGRGLPIVIVAPQFAVDPYSVLTVPSVKTWADLKGKSVILGTKEDVTAITLGQLAARHGLKMDDFNILVAGSTPARYAALLSGNVQGSLLLQPFDIEAEDKGMNVLGSASDVMKNWAFTCLVANKGWLAKNGPLAVKFLRAVHRGIQFGYSHPADAVRVLSDAAHVDPQVAAKAYQLDFIKWQAWDPNLKLPAGALENVGKYQISFGVIRSMPPIATLYDGSYAAQAIK